MSKTRLPGRADVSLPVPDAIGAWRDARDGLPSSANFSLPGPTEHQAAAISQCNKFTRNQPLALIK